MARTYRNAREHLDDQIALVAQLVERQIRAHWELGILPPIKDEFSGTFVSGDEVRSLLAGGRQPTPEGQKRIKALDAAITARAERIEAKLASAREDGAPLAFDRLRSTFQLTPTEQRAIWVLLAIEVSSRLRHLMRYLVNESSRIHADVGLLEMLVYSAPETRDLLITELAPDSRLFEHRLLEPVGSKRQNEDAPFLLRPLRVSRRVLELAHGILRLDRDVAGVATLVKNPVPFSDLVLRDELKSEIRELFRAAERAAQKGTSTPAVVLAGLEGSGRKALAFGAAGATGCAALHVRCAALPNDTTELRRLSRSIVREAILFRAVPVFEAIDELAPMPEIGRPDRGKYIDAAISKFRGPVAGTCEPHDSRPVTLSRGVVLIDIPVPSEADRVELWKRAFEDRAPLLDFTNVAARYPITGGIIFKSALAAMSLAEARGTPKGTDHRDVHVGLRSTLDSKLSALGKRVVWRQGWDDLVLPDESIDEIREFIARVKHRRRVYDDWGFALKMAKGLGLSALFAGPPGTGKTMVAGIIADELALDLYQIDLSRIVSKYVGETEKNLSNLFDAAEAGHAILLFDEADSLFAKRTEVKSSVDRYANLEVNYLLQRMEAFNGITILTTNLDSSIDDAFRRRISFKVNFPFPEPEDRVRLWQAMLPREAEVGDDIDFSALSEKYEMSGGYIRNAVLRAAFLAAEEDSSISMRHLKRAANLEYQAMGKVVSSL
jgi:predicted nucleic acid-binding protein